MSESILKQIMAEFDAAKEDGGWDEGHPIFQMAEDIDASHKRIEELEAKLIALCKANVLNEGGLIPSSLWIEARIVVPNWAHHRQPASGGM